MSQTYIPAAVERLVRERAWGECEYCRCLLSHSADPFSVDHVIPESAGGLTEASNLALSCLGCNSIKGSAVVGRDAIDGMDTPLFHPRRQRWTQHFAWSLDSLMIVGRTPTGRATVERLRLNRPGLLNLRTALQAIGVHPPPER